MVSRIQPLPDDVVHRIAAGEVIDSLAAVVRELIENALDAGASRIAISVWANQWKVRVADNGQGMTLEELQQAATPHSTSKIHQETDLWHITSLGFRGEALHSLAQLADLEICSRSPHADEGWMVRYNHQGNPNAMEVVAIAPGTVVTVSDLFGHWLPRRQNLPAPAQQLRAIQLTIHSIALCHPEITWQVEQGDRSWFAIWGSPTAKQILPQLLKDIHPSDLQELHVTPSALSPQHSVLSTQSSALSPQPPALYLLLGLPDRCHRYRPDWVKVAVNGRMVKFPELEQTILNALRRTLPRDRHPVCFIHLHLPPQLVDWNRHPAKAEIFIRDLEQHQQQITDAIAQALQLSPAKLPDAAYRDRMSQLIKTAEAPAAYPSVSNTGELSVPISTELRAIAQLHQMYIVAEHPTGIWLVEQHIAHERVLYEELCDRWQLVPLDPPILLNQLTSHQLEQLQRLGMTVDAFGDTVWAVRTVPEPLSQREDCAEALLELSQGGDLEAALVATACRTAIRNGTPLSLEEMQSLLNQWQQTRNARTCPHGRPICLPLKESSLSRYFRRHWVVGKSHGI